MKKILAILIVSMVFVTQVFATPDMLIPIGRTAGITVMYDGVLIAGTSQVDTENGYISPAQNADIRQGDMIYEIDGQKVLSNEEIVEIVTNSSGKDLIIVVKRDDEFITKTVTPVCDKTDGAYKIGVWVRDSMAGVGTITYIDPETNTYGGLGHAISDYDTGELTAISQGNLIPSSVESVIKGVSGKAGELDAEYNAMTQIGTVMINSDQGIFGKTDSDYFNMTKAVPVADFSEIELGKAYVLTNVNGEQVEGFEISILSITNNDGDDKNFIIQVTDDDLIDITGGIVQGMSGSPILQNGKIIGALTHVFVNDPTAGYGIYIGNMLETAETLEN